MSDPLANRECGDCNVCCWSLTIVELKKPPGVVCRHWTKDCRCTIYDSRPPGCREFLCGWRTQWLLDDEWRPDKCGIVIYGAEGGMQFELLGAWDKVYWRPLVNVIANLIIKNVPAFLSARAAVGLTSHRVPLNSNAALRNAVARHDVSAITAELSQALQVSIDAPKTKMEFAPDEPGADEQRTTNA